MRRGFLLRTLILKEIKTMLRDRQQLFALVVGFASAVFTVASIEISVRIEASAKEAKSEKQGRSETTAKLEKEDLIPEIPDQAGQGDPAEQPSEDGLPPSPNLVRWGIVGAGFLVAWYASFFAITLALATFVGEKEKGTLEVLLMTPPSDRALFFYKFLAVVIPGSAYGLILLFLFIPYGLIFQGKHLAVLSGLDVAACILLCLPLPLAQTALHVGLGACCSVRARTMQGAGMILGGAITLIMFLVGGMGALLGLTDLKDPFLRAVVTVLGWPFVVQYGIMIALLLGGTTGAYMVGRLLFHREKMLLA